MFLSYEWLSDFLDLSQVKADQLADWMSRTGIEVEGIENFGQGLDHVVVGQVLSCVPHEDSDHLKVTQVQVGPEDIRQIVCGAPNVSEGAKVIVALEGAVLPGGFKIKASKLRGVMSYGMLCSLQELGFKDSVVPKQYADGLFLLPEDAPLGQAIVEYLKLDDPILELSITPNRADALSMRGCAYEVGAILDQVPQFKDERSQAEGKSDFIDQVSVQIVENDLSGRYQARVIEGVTIKESPIWMQIRLMKAGIRPINNVVDVTNYCLLLFGQPMHAFDFDRLANKSIAVANGKEGQVLVTLDGVERQLNKEDIVILSGEEPIALAGIMGGLNTEVTEHTTRVLLETAVFNRQRVRKTASRLNLRSESSTRFEKGINLDTLDLAGQVAAELIATLSGGKVEVSIKEAGQARGQEKEIQMDYDVIGRKLGIKVNSDDLSRIFKRLQFGFEDLGTAFKVTVPARRWDIEIDADVLEEIARIYGYDKIPATLPVLPSTPGRLNDKQILVRASRRKAESMGLNQVISYVLTSEKSAQLLRGTEGFVRLAMPMSEERAVLRQSMLPALLEIAQYNQARQNKRLAFYEIGKVFFSQENGEQPREAERISFLLSGQKQVRTWSEPESTYNFFDMKGMVEAYLNSLGLVEKVGYVASTDYIEMHPGRTANIFLGDKLIGIIGQLHPDLTKEYDLSAETLFAELDFDALIAAPKVQLVQKPIPKYPSTHRDLALLIDLNFPQEGLVTLMKEFGGPYLVSVELFDRFVDERLGQGKQSLAYRLTFQNPERTLRDTEIHDAMENIQTALKKIKFLEIR